MVWYLMLTNRSLINEKKKLKVRGLTHNLAFNQSVKILTKNGYGSQIIRSHH